MRVELRARATDDIESAAAHYLTAGGESLARRYIDAVERTVGALGEGPRTGSLRFAYELSIPDLRVLPVHQFPYLVFYVTRTEKVDVWRVLHTKRDISQIFAVDAS